MFQPTQNNQDETPSRAKEIDHGTLPLTLENVILGLPVKPGIQFDDRSSVNATKWTYDQLVSQKQFIGAFNITPTTDFSKPIFAMRNSWQNIMKLHFRTLSTAFYFKSWKWHLTFQFRSNFQQVGMMTLSYVNLPADAAPYIIQEPISYIGQKPEITAAATPDPNSGYRATVLDKLETIYQLPHTLIMMGEDQDVECTFNWLSPFKSAFYDKNPNPYPNNTTTWPILEDASYDDYDMGMIRLHVPVPMTTATGVNTNLTVRVWSHLTDVEYAGYIPRDAIL